MQSKERSSKGDIAEVIAPNAMPRTVADHLGALSAWATVHKKSAALCGIVPKRTIVASRLNVPD